MLDAYLLLTPVNELYEMGILQEQTESDVREQILTFTCLTCQEEYTNTWQRSISPDHLSRGMHCLHCGTPTMILTSVAASTISYRSRAMEIGSFSDNGQTRCWKCDTPTKLELELSNEQVIRVCPLHYPKYAKETYKAKERKRGRNT